MSPPMTARERLLHEYEIILDALSAHFNRPGTSIMLAIGETPQLYYRIARQRTMTTRLFDRMMPRLSALWPAGKQWPGDIPRPHPESAEIKRHFLDRPASEPARGSIPSIARKLRPTRARSSVKVIEGEQ